MSLLSPEDILCESQAFEGISGELTFYGKKTLYRCARILYNNTVLKQHNRQFETILSLNKTTGAAGR